MRPPLTAPSALCVVLLALAPGAALQSGAEQAAEPSTPPAQPPELAALLARIEANPAPEEAVKLLRDAGYLLQDLGRNAEAAQIFERGAGLARSLGDRNLLVVHLGNLANSCFFLGELERGLAACDEALAAAQELGRDDHIWRLANTSGAVNLRLSRYTAALSAFELALDHLPKDEPASLGLLYSNLATAHMHVGEFARAHELLDLALPLLTEHASPLYASAVYATRADLRVLEQDFAAALGPQEQALRMRREAGAELEIAQSLVGLGRIHSGLGQPERAREVLEEALEIQRRLGLQADQVATLGCLAEVYAVLGRGAEAQGAALEGLALADEISVLGQRVETLHSLAFVLEAEGDYARALEVLREALELERQLNTLDVRQRTAELEESIELARTESELLAERERRGEAELQEQIARAEAERELHDERERRREAELQEQIARAEAERELHDERERRRRQLAWVSASACTVLSAAALAGWTLYWSKRRTLRELDRAHKELRAASNAARERSQELASALGEIRDLEDERLRGAQLESLGVLARGIAHDFNNALTAILGNVTLARLGSAGRPELEGELEASVSAIDQASRLSRQLIEFARGAAPAPELCSLGPLAREGAALAATGSGARLVFDLPLDLWLAEIDRVQFLQVVINLVLNAVQAMPGGGTVTLRARNLAPAADNGNLGPAVEIAIEDTGPGIPDDLRERVFDPCFTTKPTGRGLGLSTVDLIARRNGGSVRLERGRQGGARFVVRLPAAPDAPLPAPAAAEDAPAPLPPARILAMDDEAGVRDLYERMGQRLGLDITLAADGPAAVAQFERARASGRPFDLLILDLTLPGEMNGVAVLEALHRIDPGTPAIVASGYSDSGVLAHPERAGFAGKLDKPFTLELLARAIRTALSLRARPDGPPAR